ncbi:hypothetical protein ADP71_16880 [Vitreoscilla sp. C1]|nr:hypothetical protein ADP71_16880 [Vitreoscilla sp. C1]
MAYQLVDACYQVLMRPEMSTEQTWAWANEYLPQKNVLLQKLALYTIAHHPAYTADEKFTLVTNTLDMHALDFHAEIFDFFKHCLMNLSDDNIELVIESLNDYPNQDNGHCEQWAFWLKQCHATDSAIDAYYQQQKQLHPHYQLSDNPYLHIFIGEASVISPRSPYPSEQLLAQQDAAWFDELLTYNQQSWDGSEPDTEGLWREIIQACQQNPTWAMAFIQHAIDTQNNTKKLHQVISGFAQWQFTDLKQWDACFKYFQTLPIKQYSNLLCNLIDQTHRNAFFKNQSESTTQPNRLVSTLLQEQAIDSQSGFSSTYYAFGEHANVYNSNIGYVISYLIMAFEKSIQTENIHNQTQSFSAIKSSLKNDNSGHVIHLLMAQYGFFEHHQPDFAHEKLLPYLNTTHPQHLLAWSGFLMNNQLTVHTYGLIETDLKTLLQSHKPQDNLLSDFDKRCLNLYLWSISLNYHSNATDSINWFLKLASAPLSKNLTKILTDILKAKYSDTNSRRCEAIPDWMVQYWQQRDHGVGGKLDASEYECLWMLSVNCPDWIPQIYEFLMQSDNLNAHSSWLLLIREKQEQLKPQDITQWAQLLNQYLKLQPNFYHINGKCLDFISFILKQDIEETIKQSIHDTLNRNGIDVKEFDLK